MKEMSNPRRTPSKRYTKVEKTQRQKQTDDEERKKANKREISKSQIQH